MKDKKLLYTAGYYQEKLSAYAKDTITYNTLPFGIGIKINRHGNPAIVEDLGTYFKFYVSAKPDDDDPLGFGSNRRASHSVFLARIYISENDLVITTIIHPITKIVYSVIWLLTSALAIIMTLKGASGSILLWVFCSVAILFTITFGRIKFKTSVIRFLNNL